MRHRSSTVESGQDWDRLRPDWINIRYLPICALIAVSSMSLASCMEATSDPEVERVSTEKFKVTWAAPLPRVSKFLSGNTMRIYLHGTDVTSTNHAAKEAILTPALMAWVDAVRPVSKSMLITSSDIVYDYVGTNPYDIDINWAGESGRAMANQGIQGAAWMVLYQGDTFPIPLHEFGHVFQLSDTYIEGVWTCQPGEPHSVMCDNGTAFSTLQPDDIAGIRTVFRMAYPNLIDLDPALVMISASRLAR